MKRAGTRNIFFFTWPNASSGIIPDSKKCIPDKHSESGLLVVPENGNSERNFVFITKIDFIAHNRSFIFIGYENE